MKTIQVQSRNGKYSILIGDGLLGEAGSHIKKVSAESRVMIVTQPPVARNYLQPLIASLRKSGFDCETHHLPDGETAKSQREMFHLYERLLKGGFERRDMLVALGGGVVGDLAGFVAATYLRGVPYVQIGTTLLAQVDSSIGGKTAVNLQEGKNLIGAFNPPILVISDTGVLKSLPPRELRASMGEVVKYGIIRSPRLFSMLEKSEALFAKKDAFFFESVIAESAKIKAGIVSRDEFETKKERMILNLGHTFAHGFEQVTGYKRFLHGEAVGIGIAAAAKLAAALKICPASVEKRIVNILVRYGLPVHIKGCGLKAASILDAMMRDKKKQHGRLRFILPSAIGKVVVAENVSAAKIGQILKSLGAVS